jgi:hypothetical protein
MKIKIRSVATLMGLAAMPIFCQSPVTEEQKALDSFKKLVRHHADSYKSNGRVHVTKLGGGWAKERLTIDPASMKFDVEKTASLVSPFVGTLAFTLNRSHSAFHPTEDEAAADSVFTHEDRTVHKHVFAYQDYQWQPTSRQYQHVGGSLDGYYPCDELLLKEEKPSAKDIHGCLEEFDGEK